MFVSAIEEVSNFTRPIHFVTRNYKSDSGIAGSATMFFVNESGVAVTCKHVTEILGKVAATKSQYSQFVKEKSAIAKTKQYDRHLKILEEKFQYSPNITIDFLVSLMNVTSEPSITFHWIDHSTYDLSILIIDNFKNLLYKSHAYFLKDSSELKQGKYLCRLGFPFPEFTNFEYDQAADQLIWNSKGINISPQFPIDGMLTRHLKDGTKMFGVEMSTPGLRGQSGGPLFDKDGIVYGMQMGTNHLHLGFDMKNQEINSDGKKIKVDNQPFLHVGWCLHVDIIKDFLKQNNIKFYEK